MKKLKAMENKTLVIHQIIIIYNTYHGSFMQKLLYVDFFSYIRFSEKL